MSGGVSILGSDHQALINLINGLYNDLEIVEGPTALDKVFEQLALYVDCHFAREESVMEACNYAAIDAHREAHRHLAQEIQGFHDRHTRGGDCHIEGELFDFLKDWLDHHILIQDVNYKRYAEGRPRAVDAAERFGSGLSDPSWRPPGGGPSGGAYAAEDSNV